MQERCSPSGQSKALRSFPWPERILPPPPDLVDPCDSLYLPPSKQKVKCTCTNRLHMKACLAEMTLVGLCADAEACRVYDRCRPIPFKSIGRCAV